MAVDSYIGVPNNSSPKGLASCRGWLSLWEVNLRVGTYFLNLYKLLVGLQELIGATPPSEFDPLKGLTNPANSEASIMNVTTIKLAEFPRPPIMAERLADALALISHDARELELSHTADRLLHVREYVAKHNPTIGDQRLKFEIEALEQSLVDDLKKLRIFFPDRDKFRKYYNKSYGEEVDAAFPEASKEIRSAANCYVYDEPTACVFHCMRTAEYGLRGLAKRIAPKLHAEKLEWGSIVRELRKKIEELHQPGKRAVTPQRKKRLDFYSDALDQCVYFKSIRDDAMHARGHYETADALKALTHVEEFMRLLAKNGIRLIPKIAGLAP